MGATTDCFKCVELNLTCDRRRPYCSQCLDAGQDCSGYKTQLTWGVGVASRGKLRGLSLPIAGTQKVCAEDSSPRSKRRRDSILGNVNQPLSPFSGTRPVQGTVMPQLASVAPLKPSPMPISPSATTPSMQGTPWDATFFAAPHPFDISHGGYSPPMLSPHPYTESNFSPATIQQSAVSSHEPPWPAQSMSNAGRFATGTLNTSFSAPNTNASCFDHPGSLSTTSGLISPSHIAIPEARQVFTHQPNQQAYDGITMLLRADQSIQLPQDQAIEDVDEEVLHGKDEEYLLSENFSLVSASPPFDLNLLTPVLSGVHKIGKTTRMQYLISYYAEVISPVIVAFDDATNPFRTQILRLAESSETLQHAICALAASNLRQRRGIGLLSTGKTAPARRSSFAHVQLSSDYGQHHLTPEQQIREEILHKRFAVTQLNQQLSHPVMRKGDVILATLLILCLFHICDSGIAKFQTQFAGVRKLLALRGDDTKLGSAESRWMSRLFTWYDTLAATVNDRDRQITGQFLDMSALCGDWSLESIAGIDGQLFKSISRLGRLNMLWQGKDVVTDDSILSMPMPPTPVSIDTYAALDSSTWKRHDSAIGLGIDTALLDDKKRFWQEWNEVRHELLDWNLDRTIFDSPNRGLADFTMDQRTDLENISESFRYSALLYLERLAQPRLPSSDEAIQQWVRKSLKHIKQVVSDVYLLWPLFITGTECLDEDSRNIIRGRCADIQKDSGFVNNASCLLLLEKVWQANSPFSSPSSAAESVASPVSCRISGLSDGSAFAFRDVMIREMRGETGGEYIVV